MIDQKKRTVRFETSALLPLKLVLIEAEKDLPARAPKGHDVNEELALKLIAQMKKKCRKVHVIARTGGRVGGVRWPYRDPARSNPLIREEIASLTHLHCTERRAVQVSFVRNDIQLEP